MKTLIAAIVFLGAAVLLLGVNIFFFRRPFPDGEISRNSKMKQLGIKCVKQEEMELHAKGRKKVCPGNYSPECSSCALYKK